MMQPQGLGALMPQGQQQAPQMNNPRLNAAMDVVTSDAEEQILDPRTLAMLKYKDALQAMQAADQMMAASQPQPMPPTVAERTKLAAEQGIAGLASRLSPGIQRQGGNMQAQQMQQAMSGGLPQLSAPNMARMAGGGIVAFQDGGRPEDKFLFTDEFGNPVYESDLARTMNAGAVDDTPEGRARRAQYEAMQREGVNLRDAAQTPARREVREPPSVAEEIRSFMQQRTDRTGQGENLAGVLEGARDVVSGAAGSAVDAARGAASRIPRRVEGASQGDEYELADFISSYQPSRADQLMLQVGDYVKENPVESAAMAAMAAPAATTGLAALGTGLLARRFAPSVLSKLFTRPNPQAAFGPVQNARVISPFRTGATTLTGKEAIDYLTAEGGEQLATAEQATSAAPSGTPTAPAGTAAEQVPTRPMSDVDRLLAQLENEVGGAAPGGDQGFRMRGVGQPARTTGTTTAAPDSGLASLRAKTDVIRDRNLDPTFVEDTRRDVEDRASDAYAVPEELKALYQSRIDALNKPMFTPEEERSREINALLSGLASSNLIAQGGPAASRAVAEVSDAIRADSTARAEQQFELASSLMDMDRQAAQQAFSAGLDATTTAMNQQGVALQMAISQLNTADNNEAAAIADSAARRVEYIQMSIEAAQKGQSNAAEVQRNLSAMIRSNNDDIANLLATGFPGQPPSAEVLGAINAIRNINATLQSAFNAASSSAGFPIPEVTEQSWETYFGQP
jgi:hypothetical protein